MVHTTIEPRDVRAADPGGAGGVLEFVELWRLLEPAIAAMAAYRIDSEEIAELYQLCDEAATAGSVEELIQNDLEFHRRIAVAAGNSSLVWLLGTLARPSVSGWIWRGVDGSEAAERAVTEHRGIVDALASRNAELAHCWCTVHVAGMEDRLRATL